MTGKSDSFFFFFLSITVFYAGYLCVNPWIDIWVVYNLAVTNKAAMNIPGSKCKSQKNENSKIKYVFFGFENIS